MPGLAPGTVRLSGALFPTAGIGFQPSGSCSPYPMNCDGQQRMNPAITRGQPCTRWAAVAARRAPRGVPAGSYAAFRKTLPLALALLAGTAPDEWRSTTNQYGNEGLPARPIPLGTGRPSIPFNPSRSTPRPLGTGPYRQTLTWGCVCRRHHDCRPGDCRLGAGDQMLIISPAMPSTASLMASDIDGCGKMLRPTSSVVMSHICARVSTGMRSETS